MVSGESKADRDASQFRTLLAERFEDRISKLESRLDDLSKTQAELHAENRETFSEIKIKMAVMQYRLGVIFAVASATFTLVGGVVLKKLGLL